MVHDRPPDAGGSLGKEPLRRRVVRVLGDGEAAEGEHPRDRRTSLRSLEPQGETTHRYR